MNRHSGILYIISKRFPRIYLSRIWYGSTTSSSFPSSHI